MRQKGGFGVDPVLYTHIPYRLYPVLEQGHLFIVYVFIYVLIVDSAYIHGTDHE